MQNDEIEKKNKKNLGKNQTFKRSIWQKIPKFKK
jgi:hypothetical protein